MSRAGAPKIISVLRKLSFIALGRSAHVLHAGFLRGGDSLHQRVGPRLGVATAESVLHLHLPVGHVVAHEVHHVVAGVLIEHDTGIARLAALVKAPVVELGHHLTLEDLGVQTAVGVAAAVLAQLVCQSREAVLRGVAGLPLCQRVVRLRLGSVHGSLQVGLIRLGLAVQIGGVHHEQDVAHVLSGVLLTTRAAEYHQIIVDVSLQHGTVARLAALVKDPSGHGVAGVGGGLCGGVGASGVVLGDVLQLFTRLHTRQRSLSVRLCLLVGGGVRLLGGLHGVAVVVRSGGDGMPTRLIICISKKCNIISGESTDLCKKIIEISQNGETVVFDSKRIYSALLKSGLKIPEKLFTDVKLAAYLLDPNASSYGVNALALSYNITAPDFSSPDKTEADEIRDAFLLLPLSERLSAVLESNLQTALFRDIELPLAAVLAETEKAGMGVDADGIRAYSGVLEANADSFRRKIYEDVGEEFNINSPKQLGVILFEKLGLPCKKKTKTGYSTNADVLEDLAEQNATVAEILQYRTFSKLKSTYCDGLLKSIAPDGRIHSSFNQTETRTGRLSSTEPNLQNIPVRTPVGREFRKFFVARDGFSIVDADYSQIELRVLAAMADDKNMTEAFNSGADIHTITASKVFDVPLENVTPELRSKAKAVNFGIVYGIGAFSLSKDIHSTRSEAESFINAYLALYSSVDSFMKECIEKAKKNGYAETLFNRRRYLPELTSSNRMMRAFGERVARNMPIQGTAADIIKIAMIKTNRRLKEEIPEAELIMQVHDELIVEAPVEKAEKAAEILKREMETAVSLAVTLRADVGIGKTWYDAKG